MVAKHCAVGDSGLHFKKVNLLKAKRSGLPQHRACHMVQWVLDTVCPWCMIHEVQGRWCPVRSTCEGQDGAGNRRVSRWPSAIRMKSSSYPMFFHNGLRRGGAAAVGLAQDRGSEYLPSGTYKEDLIAGSLQDCKISRSIARIWWTLVIGLKI